MTTINLKQVTIHDIVNNGIEIIKTEEALKEILISVRYATVNSISDNRTIEILKEIITEINEV